MVKKSFGIIFLSFLILIILPFLGRTFEFDNAIFWDLRVPRVLTCLLAGGGLAVGGLVFQAIFRNDLATPYTLGVASGASLGAALSIYFGLGSSFGWIYWNETTLGSFFGGLTSFFLLYSIAIYHKNFGRTLLLLSGVAMSMICSSLILFIQFISNEMDSLKIIQWLVGNVNIVGLETPLSLIPFVIFSLILIFFGSGELNLLRVGEIFAQSRGVCPKRVRKRLIFLVSLLITPIVAECGPIGFVGLIIPHMIKALGIQDHRFLIWICFFSGGAFLGICDLISRSLFENSLLPVGVVTALFGAPFFLWSLTRFRQY